MHIEIRNEPFFPLNLFSSGMPSCRYWSNCTSTSSGVALCFLTIAFASSYRLLRAPCSDNAKEEFERHRRASRTPNGSLRNWDFESTQIEYRAMGKRRWLISWRGTFTKNRVSYKKLIIYTAIVCSSIETLILICVLIFSCSGIPEGKDQKQNISTLHYFSLHQKPMKISIPWEFSHSIVDLRKEDR